MRTQTGYIVASVALSFLTILYVYLGIKTQRNSLFLMATLFTIMAGLNVQLAISSRKLDYYQSHAQPPAPGVIPPASTFHRPVNADCPAGTTLMKDFFNENDGSHLDACHNPHGNDTIDYLSPGEGVTFTIQLLDDDRPEKKI